MKVYNIFRKFNRRSGKRLFANIMGSSAERAVEKGIDAVVDIDKINITNIFKSNANSFGSSAENIIVVDTSSKSEDLDYELVTVIDFDDDNKADIVAVDLDGNGIIDQDEIAYCGDDLYDSNLI